MWPLWGREEVHTWFLLGIIGEGLGCAWEDNIKVHLEAIGLEGVE
jgi:hypothetical protein